jgi:hypothetical protein
MPSTARSKRLRAIVASILITYPAFAAGGETAAAKIEHLIESVALAKNVPITSARGLSDEPTAPAKTQDVFNGAAKGTYFLCSTQQYSLENNASSYVMGNYSDYVYPGALIQGDSLAPDSQGLRPITAARGPGELVLNIIGGGEGHYSTRIKKVTNATVLNAINNDLLGNYKGGTPASISYKIVQIYSQDQLAVEMGANYPGIDFSSHLTLNQTSIGSSFLIELNQAFFTISFTPPDTPAGFFKAKKVKLGVLRQQIGPGNPPLYISSVTYGRRFYLLFQSNQFISNQDFKSSFDDDISGSTTTHAHNIFSKTTVTGYAVGGSASAAMSALISTKPQQGSDAMKALRAYFVEDASYSKANPPVPVSFQLNLVKDNSTVAMRSTAQYTQRNCTVTPKTCAAFTNRQGNDYITAEFDVPETAAGKSVSFKNGEIHTYHFPRCYRVKWEDVKYACKGVANDTMGTWQRGVNYHVTKDAACGGKHYRNDYTYTVGTQN